MGTNNIENQLVADEMLFLIIVASALVSLALTLTEKHSKLSDMFFNSMKVFSVIFGFGYMFYFFIRANLM